MYDGKWKIDTPLLMPRRGHESLVVANRIVHIGGQGTYPFEIWADMGKGAWEKSRTEMTLQNWYKNANTFIVGPTDYQ